MCGIAGIVRRSGPPVGPSALKAMCDVLKHRGPDDAGYAFFATGSGTPRALALSERRFAYLSPHLPLWEDAAAERELAAGAFDVALGHRRLSILDLSGAGHQPMATPDGRYWITYNGEIYNCEDLRAGLKARGLTFRSKSDTEVLLRAWEVYGEAILPRLDGMFAFALLDLRERRLFLARDRFGVKPLYYAVTPHAVAFASEPKALWAGGALDADLDRPTLAEYLTFQNVLGPKTIFSGVELLPPGSVLQVGLDGTVGQVRTYYRCYAAPPGSAPEAAFESAAAGVRDRFVSAVRRQLMSDVPLGSYLSGGMDSGSIVSVAARVLPRLKTFTLGMSLQGVQGMESLFDERALAEQLSNQFETEHYTGVLRPWDLPDLVQAVTWHLDDPRVGMCYQNFHVARLAGRMVKVCLSGTGGDELFGGYPWRYARGVRAGTPEAFDEAYFQYWHRLLPSDRWADYFARDLVAERAGVRERFQDRLNAGPPPADGLSAAENLLHRALAFEFNFFLQGLLVVEDRVSMAHSLESRVPFLDNALAEDAFTLPPGFKVDLAADGIRVDAHGQAGGKRIFRRAMTPLIPEAFAKQPKQGFSTPEANWYRGPLLGYLREVLLDPQSQARWYLRPGAMTRILDEHEAGEQNHRLLLWSLLCLEWLNRHFVEAASVTARAA
jgi:asparagine synthase (glutamine-hydrolysing)